MADPRLLAADGFTQRSHSSVPQSVKPELTTLPHGFTVCIIGASEGIGEHIAYAYARARASGIIIAARRLPNLQRVRNEISKLNPEIKVEIASCDVASADSVQQLAEMVQTKFERLDVLVLNAAYANPVTLKMHEGRPEDFQQAFNVNAMGTYYAAHYFVPLLLKAQQGAKCFIAIGSFAGLIRRGIIANTGYCVSKMAQIRLVEHLEEQYGEEQGLLSCAIHPGAVRTSMAEGNTPEEFMPCEFFLSTNFCALICELAFQDC